MKIESGIPIIADYNKLIKSDLFKDMELSSDKFIRQHSAYMKRYRWHWVADPLHQWGRQWEYPFVYSRLEDCLRNKAEKNATILDAGSGATFFPYYCAGKFPDSSIFCCDYDKTLEKTFARINRTEKSTVDFKQADIRHLPFENSYFDVIYCISVLEHTSDYSTVLKEFKRVLKPGGLFVITFDVSLDGFADIPIDIADKLLCEIVKNFEGAQVPDVQKIATLLQRKEQRLTTEYIYCTDRKLLPWKYPALSAIKTSLLKRKFPTKLFKNITCYCLSVIKK
ncbi:MAG: class I SAM-dependent methyltransferase [Candidatus Omnitrophica bacterium]|nr:class I SAM-dependent methyltransferase [Candidatus Omnitrophota bacterium]